MQRRTSATLKLSIILALLAPAATAGPTRGATEPTARIRANSRPNANSIAAAVRCVRGDTPGQAEQLRNRLQVISNPTSHTRSGAAASISRAYGPCILRPSAVYLRKEYGYEAVGTKPVTRCTVPVTSIHHRTDLRYHWYNWWLQAGTTFIGHNEDESVYTSRKIHVACVGKEATIWSGTTLGTVLYKGHTYYARVYQDARELDCGADWP